MKIRKLIEKEKISIIQCDNPQCDYKIDNIDGCGKIVKDYIYIPCPKCGENLLTLEDYNNSEKIIKLVDFINRWFSWITLFIPKKQEGECYEVHCYNGINIKKINKK